MKNSKFLSVLAVPLLLSGCSSLFGNKMTFKKYNHEVDQTEYRQTLLEKEQAVGYEEFGVLSAPSFTVTTEEKVSVKVKNVKGSKTISQSDERAYKTTTKHDSKNHVISLVHNYNFTIKETDRETKKDTLKVNLNYQIENNEFVSVDNVRKVYKLGDEYNFGFSAENSVNSRANGQLMTALDGYNSFMPDMHYYVDDNVLTTVVDNTDTFEGNTVNTKLTTQIVISGNEWTLKMAEIRSSDTDDNSYTSSSKRYVTTKIKWADVTVKKVDISKYQETTDFNPYR